MTALAKLDAFAHFLYAPTMRGHRVAVARWHHRLHLIPARLLKVICDRYERWLGYPGDEVIQPSTVLGWSCKHAAITAGGGMITSRPTVGCGCVMEPLYANTSSANVTITGAQR